MLCVLLSEGGYFYILYNIEDHKSQQTKTCDDVVTWHSNFSDKLSINFWFIVLCHMQRCNRITQKL